MYCPKCGKETFERSGPKKFVCANCSFTFFVNIASAVVVIIWCGEEILFTIRLDDPGRGMLDLPGGFADENESLEGSARRKLKEELNLDVHQLKYLFSLPNEYFYKDIEYKTMDAFFEVHLDTKPEIKIADDVAGCEWKRLDDINLDDIALKSIRKCIHKLKHYTHN